MPRSRLVVTRYETDRCKRKHNEKHEIHKFGITGVYTIVSQQ